MRTVAIVIGIIAAATLAVLVVLLIIRLFGLWPTSLIEIELIIKNSLNNL